MKKNAKKHFKNYYFFFFVFFIFIQNKLILNIINYIKKTYSNNITNLY